jgi:hypothetical protein
MNGSKVNYQSFASPKPCYTNSCNKPLDMFWANSNRPGESGACRGYEGMCLDKPQSEYYAR